MGGRSANTLKSKVRSHVEHVVAVQKDRIDLFIRTIGIARATTKIGTANLVYNIKRTLERLAGNRDRPLHIMEAAIFVIVGEGHAGVGTRRPR